ncbi:MAG: HAMP domain-containing histidine kinase [Paludibacteraceae bacterium]|nr:HAMP domain-containing histidine kinase [Paludibacteraceae bacterium]
MTNSRKVSVIVLSISLLIIVLSVAYTTWLSHKLAIEEHKKIEIWAEATRQFLLADENTDIDFVTSIIEGNTTIPVYMVDAEGQLLISRNAKDKMPSIESLSGPIEVKISDTITQYIYYDESTLLYQLHYVPYIQFALIFVFIGIAILIIYVSNRSEQNHVWAGLCKETAHQLGTPISSLNAWEELLSQRYPQDEYLPQMRKDIERLQAVADRFSKIGSKPELIPTDIIPALERTLVYMRSRISNKVEINNSWQQDTSNKIPVLLNEPLFTWVIENVIKNAVDAMNGKGTITFALIEEGKYIYIDITDTGKGISRRRRNSIFQPGYTTKQRGWGLGLSLSKRIIEDYHRGKLFVQSSQMGVGTTFRIVLKKAVNS